MNPSIVRNVRLETVHTRIKNMEPGERLLVYSEQSLKTALMSRLSRISEKIKISLPQKNTVPFTCPHCDQNVRQSHSNDRRINTCSCLTAIFSPPYTDLCAKEWKQWGSLKALHTHKSSISRISTIQPIIPSSPPFIKLSIPPNIRPSTLIQQTTADAGAPFANKLTRKWLSPTLGILRVTNFPLLLTRPS